MSSTSNHDEQWANTEQLFMRVLSVGLLIIAVISMIYGVFPTNGSGALTRYVNIGVTMLLGVGAIWSLWWSSDLKRMYNLIDGFKENGSGRTYIAAIMQGIVGLLFVSELMGGQVALGAIGILALVSAGFFIWRAQQISHAAS